MKNEQANFCYHVHTDPSDDTVKIPVNTFPWLCKYRPETFASLRLQDDHLTVSMTTNEWPLRAVVTAPNGPVYTDSCMEFFLMPAPRHSKAYVNFEINPWGVPLIEIGDQRENRKRLIIPEYRRLLSLTSRIDSDGWSLSYQIPLSFLKNLIGHFSLESGDEMKANFYKCGDKTDHPHYGCWATIDRPTPDFHVPESFGTLIID